MAGENEFRVPITGDDAGLRAALAQADAAIARTEREVNRRLRGVDAAFARTRLAVSTSLSGVNTTVAATASAVGRAGAAMAAGFSAAALIQFTRQAIDAVGGLGELAEQAGITVEQLQVLDYGAIQAGISADEMRTAFQRFNRQIGEAANGNKAAIESFDQVGIKILDAGGKIRPTGDILRDFADRIAAMPDPAKRAAAAQELLGRAGQQLLPILSQGAAGLDKLREAAHKAGVVHGDELVAGMDSAGDAIAVLEKQILAAWQSLVGQFVPGITSTLRETSTLVGGIGDLTAAFSDLERATGFFGADWVNRIGRGWKAGGREPFLDQLRTQYDAIEEALGSGDIEAGTRAELLNLRKRIETDFESLGEVSPAGLRLTIAKPAITKPTSGARNPTAKATGGSSKKTDAEKAAEKTADVIKALQFEEDQLGRTARQRAIYSELAKAGVTIDSAAGKTIAVKAGHLFDEKRARDELSASIERNTEAAEAERRQRETERERAKQMLDAKTALFAGIDQEIADNARLAEALGISTDAYEKERVALQYIAQLRAIMPGLTDEEIAKLHERAAAFVEGQDQLEAMQARGEYLEQALTSGFDRVGDAITQVAVEGGDAWENFGNVARGVLAELQREILRLGVLNPLKNSLLGTKEQTLGGLLGGLFDFGGGGGGTSAAGYGGSFGLDTAFGGYFAAGGRPPPGRPSIVGEEGPELFWPDQAGTIVPNHALPEIAAPYIPPPPFGDRGGGGGSAAPVINMPPITINAPGADAAALRRVEAAVMDLSRNFEKRAIGAVVNERRHNDRMFGGRR